MLMSRCLKRLLFCLALLHSAQSLALAPENWTEGELVAAAPFCIDTQTLKYGDKTSKNVSPNADHWVGLMGPGFWHMHHYCWARVNVARSLSPGLSVEQRRQLRMQAVGDYQYVIRNVAPDFVLLAEVYLRLGEVLKLLNQFQDAERAFKVVIEKKPNFWPGYLSLATLLRDNKEWARAREVASAGLKVAPDAKPLHDFLNSLKRHRQSSSAPAAN